MKNYYEINSYYYGNLLLDLFQQTQSYIWIHGSANRIIRYEVSIWLDIILVCYHQSEISSAFSDVEKLSFQRNMIIFSFLIQIRNIACISHFDNTLLSMKNWLVSPLQFLYAMRKSLCNLFESHWLIRSRDILLQLLAYEAGLNSNNLGPIAEDATYSSFNSYFITSINY
jgi:hypothetical protein